VLCALLEIVDVTIVNVALNEGIINWCCLGITAYAIANVIVILWWRAGCHNSLDDEITFAVSIIILPLLLLCAVTLIMGTSSL
jgi:hypothetical protein